MCDEYSGHTLPELVQLFDTAYVSFYKGLGGVTGAMLLGPADTISAARVWLRRFGGNVYSLMPYAVSCQGAFRDNRAAFPARLAYMRYYIPVPYMCMQTSNGMLYWIIKFRYLSVCLFACYRHVVDCVSMALSAGASDSDDRLVNVVRFEPPVPVVSLIHVYLRVWYACS